MGDLELQTILLLAGAAFVGCVLGWFLRSMGAHGSLRQLEN